MAVVRSASAEWHATAARGYIEDMKMAMQKGMAVSVLAAALLFGAPGAPGASAQSAPAGPQAGSPAASLAAQYPIHDSVNDYAGVLDADTRAQLLDAVKQLEVQHKVHLNIVIVRSLNGESAQAVSTAIANNWESRHTASQRSVQVLLDIDEHKMRFEICQNLEKVITDADADGMRQNMTPMLREAEYGRALLNAAQNLSDLLAEKEKAAPTATAPPPAAPAPVAPTSPPSATVPPAPPTPPTPPPS